MSWIPSRVRTGGVHRAGDRACHQGILIGTNEAHSRPQIRTDGLGGSLGERVGDAGRGAILAHCSKGRISRGRVESRRAVERTVKPSVVFRAGVSAPWFEACRKSQVCTRVQERQRAFVANRLVPPGVAQTKVSRYPPEPFQSGLSQAKPVCAPAPPPSFPLLSHPRRPYSPVILTLPAPTHCAPCCCCGGGGGRRRHHSTFPLPYPNLVGLSILNSRCL